MKAKKASDDVGGRKNSPESIYTICMCSSLEKGLVAMDGEFNYQEN